MLDRLVAVPIEHPLVQAGPPGLSLAHCHFFLVVFVPIDPEEVEVDIYLTGTLLLLAYGPLQLVDRLDYSLADTSRGLSLERSCGA